VVLQDVADRACRVIESAPPGNPKGFRHGYLHALNVVPAPDWLKERVGKAEEEQILHSFLAQKMIDAEDGRLGKDGVEYDVQFLG